MKLTKLYLDFQYKLIFAEQKVKFVKKWGENNGFMYSYYDVEPNEANRRRIKHIKSMIELINRYRIDLPRNWIQYVDLENEYKGSRIETRVLKKLKKGSEKYLIVLIKCWWARDIKLHHMKADQIYSFMSFDEYMKKFIQSMLFFHDKDVSNISKGMLWIKRLDLDIKNIAQYYNITIKNDFKPDNEFISLLYPNIYK